MRLVVAEKEVGIGGHGPRVGWGDGFDSVASCSDGFEGWNEVILNRPRLCVDRVAFLGDGILLCHDITSSSQCILKLRDELHQIVQTTTSHGAV